MTDRPSVIICDIDGTVALNDGHRGHFEWDKVSGDTPNWPVVDVVTCLVQRGRTVVFVSGRMEQCRSATMQWLFNTIPVIVPTFDLFMRPDDDFRPDEVLKREIYERDILPFWDVKFVLDDRDKVVAMWRELGLTCLQVAPGDF